MNSRSTLSRYLLGAFLVRLSDDGTATALVLLALRRTGDARIGGFLLGTIMVPQILAGPVVGALADRSGAPRRLFLGGLSLLAGMQVALDLTVGYMPLAVPLAAALVAGLVSPLITGGLSSLVPDFIPAGPKLKRAQSLDSVTYSAASVVAPLGAAAMSALASPALALGVFAALAAASAMLTASLPLHAHQRRSAPPALRSALRRGLALLWQSPRLSAVTAATTGSFFAVGALPLTLALYAQALGQPANRGGFMYSAFALGALGGSLYISARPAHRTSPESVLLGCLAGCGITLAVMSILVTSLATALVVSAAAGLIEGPVLTMTFAVRGEESPGELRTQVFVTAASLKTTAAAAGSALAGLTSPLGGHLLLLSTGLIQIASVLGGVTLLLGRRGQVRQAAGPPSAEHP